MLSRAVPSLADRRARSRALLLLALCVPPTGAAMLARARLPVDLENRALKAPGTPEEAALRRRVEAVGEDHALVAVLEGRAAADPKVVARFEQTLGEAPGASSVRTLPTRHGGLAAFVVELAGQGEGEGSGAHGGYARSARELERAARAATPADARLALAGLPLVEIALAEAVQAESARVVPAVALALALCLAFAWRSVGAALAVLVPTAIGLAWTGGVRAWLGRALDPVAVLLDPVLLTVGVAAGVHAVEAWLAERTAGASAWEAAARARASLREPVASTSLTTVAGFLALAASSIPAVRDFGLFAALGSALVAWLGLTLVPACLALLAPFERRPPHAARPPRRRRARAARLVRWIEARSRWISACAVVLGLAGALAWSGVRADDEPLSILPGSHPLRADAAVVARALGGSERFDVLLAPESAFAEPSRAALLAADLEARAAVGGLAGPPLRGSDGTVVLSALLAPAGSARREQLFDALEARWSAQEGAEAPTLAGVSVQIARDSLRLIRGQQRGLLLVLPALGLVFVLAFGSARLAGLALVPNLVPCLVVQGSLLALGRSATVASALVAAAMLGLVVDDTIHLVHRWQEARRAGCGPRKALVRALESAGGAAVRTSLCLAIGFGTSLIGGLSTSRQFGALSAAIVLVALVADLLLLPALLLGMERRRRAREARALRRREERGALAAL